jgi:hypothetical protein
MKNSELIAFVENNLNNNNRFCNAVAYDDEYFDGYKNVRVTFYKRNFDMYARLLRFCADNNGIIIKTNPATLETTVRVSRD